MSNFVGWAVVALYASIISTYLLLGAVCSVHKDIGTCNEKLSGENNSTISVDIEDNILCESTSHTDFLSSGPSASTEPSCQNASVEDQSDEDSDSSDEYVPEGNESDEESSLSACENSENWEAIENITREITSKITVTTVENPDSNKNDNDTPSDVKAEKTKAKKKFKPFPDKPKICKKRIKQPETWKRLKAAASRARGKKYLSQKGHEVAKKKVCFDNLCSEKCRLKCSNEFSNDIRQSIFNEFYKLDINSKHSLLFKSIVGRPTKQTVKSARKHKSFAYYYLITRNNKQIKVCKPTFCALFQISKKKIEIIQKKLQKSSSAPSPDQRGRHLNRSHKMTDEVVDYIKDHIGKFPAEASHYSRNSNPYKKYLVPLLNMSIMYRLYLEKCENDNKPGNYKIKKTSYANIFSTTFNLSFRHPKSETCSKCDCGESNEGHRENVKCGFDLLKSDLEIARTNDAILYLTIDLQQTMPLPKLTTSKAFYLRQLWFYNLGIHAVSTDGEKPYMQTWTENIANRGSIEVISSLWNFVQNCDQAKTRNHLRIWPDSCTGQNKNFLMICFFQFLI